LIATAFVAAVGNAKEFESGRELLPIFRCGGHSYTVDRFSVRGDLLLVFYPLIHKTDEASN